MDKMKNEFLKLIQEDGDVQAALFLLTQRIQWRTEGRITQYTLPSGKTFRVEHSDMTVTIFGEDGETVIQRMEYAEAKDGDA